MDYTELEVLLNPAEPYSEILIAELSHLPFDTFEENDEGFKAYAPSGTLDKEEIKQILDVYSQEVTMKYSFREIPRENWNETWEKSFSPVEVEDLVLVRASFHPSKPGFKHEIIITPKMSFGTGHHQTTWLMMKMMDQMNFKGQKVLDMGCGTGVLGILAAKSGASEVICMDIDEWAVENSIENAELNGTQSLIQVRMGDIDDLQESGFFGILANINRNVLLRHLPVYKEKLSPGGQLLMSGFYEEDISAIREKAEECGFKFKGQDSRDNWAVLKFSI